MTTYFNTSNHIFLITFKNTTNKFICNSSESVLKCLKEQDRHKSIKNIKVLDASKERFIKASKNTLKMLLIWDAESTDFFNNHYYLK